MVCYLGFRDGPSAAQALESASPLSTGPCGQIMLAGAGSQPGEPGSPGSMENSGASSFVGRIPSCPSGLESWVTKTFKIPRPGDPH